MTAKSFVKFGVWQVPTSAAKTSDERMPTEDGLLLLDRVVDNINSRKIQPKENWWWFRNATTCHELRPRSQADVCDELRFQNLLVAGPYDKDPIRGPLPLLVDRNGSQEMEVSIITSHV